MAKVMQIRMDEQLKNSADQILEDLGLDMPTAIRLFLKKVVATRSIPFELKSNFTENGFTPEQEVEILQAAKEAEQGINVEGPFNSMKEAIKFLKK